VVTSALIDRRITVASQSIAFTRRQIARAKATAERSLAGPDDALKAYAPDMLEQVALYEAADRAAVDADRAAKKEVSEGDAALAALRPVFEQTRELVTAKLGITFEAASRYTTPDDLLNAAEQLEAELLADEGADWVQTVLPAFNQAMDAAVKEYLEADAARKAVQKADIARGQAEGRLRPVLVNFRRIVRHKYGPSAREYRELRDRQSRGSDDDPGNEGSSGSPV
jgi:hypothetical protein